MRRALRFGLLAAMAMIMPSALAEVYTGSTIALSAITVEAETDGILTGVYAQAGSIVQAGDALAAIATEKVFAAQDGVVARIHADAGDYCDSTVMEINPMAQYQIYCTVDQAYASADTMLVHSGEMVYIKCTADGSHRGTGVITQIDGSEYRVLATGGEFYVGETVYLYRDSEFSKKQRIGIGTVVQNDVQAYAAEGTIVRMHVSEGEYIERGELLFEYAASDQTVQLAAADGIVTEAFAAQGDFVAAGDALMEIVSADQIYVRIQVDEESAAQISAGDPAELVYRMDPTETALAGTVARVSYIAEDDTYAIDIRPAETAQLRLGLTVDVYLAEAESRSGAFLE